MLSLLNLCHAQDEADLTSIWSAIAPLSKDRDHTAIELAVSAADERIRFCTP